jgi:hypothetical protein
MCLLALSERYHLLTSSSISSTTPPYSHPRARHLASDSNQPRLPLHRPKDFTLAGKKRRTSRYRAAPYTSPSYVQPLPRRKLCAFLPLRQVLSRVSIPLFPQQPRLSFNVCGSESVSTCPYSILVSGSCLAGVICRVGGLLGDGREERGVNYSALWKVSFEHCVRGVHSCSSSTGGGGAREGAQGGQQSAVNVHNHHKSTTSLLQPD